MGNVNDNIVFPQCNVKLVSLLLDVECMDHARDFTERKVKTLNKVTLIRRGTKQIQSLKDTCCRRVVVTVPQFVVTAIDQHLALVAWQLDCKFIFQILR